MLVSGGSRAYTGIMLQEGNRPWVGHQSITGHHAHTLTTKGNLI